eukprot:3595836-Pyramimonas_sp.AAC.1
MGCDMVLRVSYIGGTAALFTTISPAATRTMAIKTGQNAAYKVSTCLQTSRHSERVLCGGRAGGVRSGLDFEGCLAVAPTAELVELEASTQRSPMPLGIPTASRMHTHHTTPQRPIPFSHPAVSSSPLSPTALSLAAACKQSLLPACYL